MRIISGKHKGRKLLDCYKLRDLRPTTDSNRESLFNILINASFLKKIGFDIKQCNLLDVFSGSGSISFEALSRGVRSATLIEQNSEHLELSKKNCEILKEEKSCEFINLDATKKLYQNPRGYNLIFIDPPYHQDLAVIALNNLIESGYVKTGAIIIVEHSIHDKINVSGISNIKLLEEKKYSKTAFSFYISN